MREIKLLFGPGKLHYLLSSFMSSLVKLQNSPLTPYRFDIRILEKTNGNFNPWVHINYNLWWGLHSNLWLITSDTGRIAWGKRNASSHVNTIKCSFIIRWLLGLTSWETRIMSWFSSTEFLLIFLHSLKIIDINLRDRKGRNYIV